MSVPLPPYANSGPKSKRITPSGVTEVQYRKALDSLRRCGDAATLQNDIASKYNLRVPVGKTIQNAGVRSLKPTQRSQLQPKPQTVACGACTFENDHASTTCCQCGYFLFSLNQPTMTLAQKKGLIEVPQKLPVVQLDEWNTIESKLVDRNEAYCPICMVGFKDGSEVLLSCSHIFHRACLTSFEKFMGKKERCCPICRTANYQKKMTNMGSKAFEVVCANKIQCLYRGYRVRKIFRSSLRAYYQQGRGEGARRKKFYQRELSDYTDRMGKDVARREIQVDSMISSMDSTLLESRQLDALFDAVLAQRAAMAQYRGSSSPFVTPRGDDVDLYGIHGACNGLYSSTNSAERGEEWGMQGRHHKPSAFWKDVLARAQERGFDECAICMGCNAGGSRACVLLSCSHVFHQQCVDNFEKFCKDEKHVCPVCRSAYERYELSPSEMVEDTKH